MDETIVRKALAFRLGDRMPKWLRVLYYIVLFGTLVYVLVWLVAKLLTAIQKFGYTIFSPNYYWPIVASLFILGIGSLLVAQFWFDLDPIGNFIAWIENTLVSLTS